MGSPRWSYVMSLTNGDHKVTKGQADFVGLIFEIDGFSTDRVTEPSADMDVDVRVPTTADPFLIGALTQYMADSHILAIRLKAEPDRTNMMHKAQKNNTPLEALLEVVPYSPHKHVPLLKYWSKGVWEARLTGARITYWQRVIVIRPKQPQYEYDVVTFEFEDIEAKSYPT